ncbi:hypothetical protein ACN38_g12205 [Penicillium nordicum]|uniref:Uncharacterized protein n=1 Tax=Penicillium nordicum TaxID=229535 RepID=A0A0M9WA59_9EURO|nr:hypothetical protein ACN38_g12205 [Penicillium nordicum]
MLQRIPWVKNNSARGGLRLQDNRQISYIHLNHPPRSTIHLDQPSSSINHPLRSTILFDQPSSSINHPLRSSNSIITSLTPLQSSISIIHFNPNESDGGGLRLQDHRQTSHNHFDDPPQSTIHLN